RLGHLASVHDVRQMALAGRDRGRRHDHRRGPHTLLETMNDISHGLIRRLRDSQDGLPAAQRSVVGVILEDPRAAAGATVEQLAQASGVSMPTIVRTCRSFGYSSVREFMLALAQDVAVSGSYLHRSVSPQ